MVKLENESFYQKVFAKCLVDSLLPAMKHAGKTKPVDAVMGLIIKSLSKDEDSSETKGMQEVISLWVNKDPFSIFSVYDSGVIVKAISQDLIKDQTGQASY